MIWRIGATVWMAFVGAVTIAAVFGGIHPGPYQGHSFDTFSRMFLGGFLGAWVGSRLRFTRS